MTDSANVELVRSLYADWERGDFSSDQWADAEIEFVLADGPEPASWTGLAGMAHGRRGRLSTWEGYRIGADEYRALDKERVLVLDHRVVANGVGLRLTSCGRREPQASRSLMAR